MHLYGFWRSAATFRVRVALNLKGIAFTETPVNLDAGEQDAPGFRRINPQGAVPALFEADADESTARPLTQSLAILEWLEERHPRPALLPPDAEGRARVRSLAALVAADTHPLYVPRVRKQLTQQFGATPEQWRAWQEFAFGSGLRALEARLAAEPDTGRFCHGDAPGMADLCLASLMLGVRVFRLEFAGIPTVERIFAACMAEDAFARAHPMRQSDAPQG